MTETTILDERAVSEIEARADAATAGPWVNPYHRCEVYQTLPDDEPHVESGWGLHHTCVQDICRTKKFEDGDFIAHAREDIPALCATVKHLRAENSDMRKAVDHWASLHARISADNTSLINQLADFSTQGEQMNELCMERVWDNGDMTDCGSQSEIGLFDERGRPACSKHGKPPKPTLREAKIALRAQGIDPKDIVNNFIDQLLRDRSDLQSQLEQLRADWKARNILLLQLSGRGELLAKEHVNPDSLDGLVAAQNEFDRLRNVVIRDLESRLAQVEQERDTAREIVTRLTTEKQRLEQERDEKERGDFDCKQSRP